MMFDKIAAAVVGILCILGIGIAVTCAYLVDIETGKYHKESPRTGPFGWIKWLYIECRIKVEVALYLSAGLMVAAVTSVIELFRSKKHHLDA